MNRRLSTRGLYAQEFCWKWTLRRSATLLERAMVRRSAAEAAAEAQKSRLAVAAGVAAVVLRCCHLLELGRRYVDATVAERQVDLSPCPPVKEPALGGSLHVLLGAQAVQQ